MAKGRTFGIIAGVLLWAAKASAQIVPINPGGPVIGLSPTVLSCAGTGPSLTCSGSLFVNAGDDLFVAVGTVPGGSGYGLATTGDAVVSWSVESDQGGTFGRGGGNTGTRSILMRGRVLASGLITSARLTWSGGSQPTTLTGMQFSGGPVVQNICGITSTLEKLPNGYWYVEFENTTACGGVSGATLAQFLPNSQALVPGNLYVGACTFNAVGTITGVPSGDPPSTPTAVPTQQTGVKKGISGALLWLIATQPSQSDGSFGFQGECGLNASHTGGSGAGAEYQP